MKDYVIGKTSTRPQDVPLMKECGFDFAESPVEWLLIPDEGEDAWKSQKEKIREAQKYMPFRSCNGFLPGRFHLTGPETTADAALEYAIKVCHRADEMGIPYLVFGSSDARNIPEGFDHGEGMKQFTEFCARLAERISDCNVVVLLENLQRSEGNVLNHLADSVVVVDAVNSPKLQMMLDVYHACQGGDLAEDVRKAGKRILHAHVADPATRNYPGYSDASIHNYIQALNDIGFQGGLSMESGWGTDEAAYPRLFKKAIATVKEWIAETR